MIEQESDNNIHAILKEREFALKEKEIALKEQETKAKIELDRRGIWFTSPLLVGIFSALFGLLGTGIGAALQGHSSLQLERQKFESSLIQKALENKDRNEAAKALLFLVDSGVIQNLDGEKIRKIAENPEQIPRFISHVVVIPVEAGSPAALLSSVRQVVPSAFLDRASDGNYINLGAFTDLQSATAFVSLVKKLGFNAQIESR